MPGPAEGACQAQQKVYILAGISIDSLCATRMLLMNLFQQQHLQYDLRPIANYDDLYSQCTAIMENRE
ncbi:hypothetical protein KIPB_015139, partial [Kipferlia bialata]|eukprot:g15139.t1